MIATDEQRTLERRVTSLRRTRKKLSRVVAERRTQVDTGAASLADLIRALDDVANCDADLNRAEAALDRISTPEPEGIFGGDDVKQREELAEVLASRVKHLSAEIADRLSQIEPLVAELQSLNSVTDQFVKITTAAGFVVYHSELTARGPVVQAIRFFTGTYRGGAVFSEVLARWRALVADLR